DEEDGTRVEGAVDAHQGVDGVLEEDGNTVAAAHAAGLQQAGERQSASVQLGVRDALVRRYDGELIGERRGAYGKAFVEKPCVLWDHWACPSWCAGRASWAPLPPTDSSACLSRQPYAAHQAHVGAHDLAGGRCWPRQVGAPD